jgi:hypothetical protein
MQLSGPVMLHDFTHLNTEIRYANSFKFYTVADLILIRLV